MEISKDKIPYDLSKINILGDQMVNGFDLLRKAIEYLGQNQNAISQKINHME
jgi:hypothetical protein